MNFCFARFDIFSSSAEKDSIESCRSWQRKTGSCLGDKEACSETFSESQDKNEVKFSCKSFISSSTRPALVSFSLRRSEKIFETFSLQDSTTWSRILDSVSLCRIGETMESILDFCEWIEEIEEFWNSGLSIQVLRSWRRRDSWLVWFGVEKVWNESSSNFSDAK